MGIYFYVNYINYSRRLCFCIYTINAFFVIFRIYIMDNLDLGLKNSVENVNYFNYSLDC